MSMSSLDFVPILRLQRRVNTGRVSLELHPELHTHVHRTSIRNAQRQMANSPEEDGCAAEKCARFG